jgi:hypothetical protein
MQRLPLGHTAHLSFSINNAFSLGWLFHIGSKPPKSIDFTPTFGSAL